MEKVVDCNHYTDLLSNKQVCLSYVKGNKVKLCQDSLIRNTYSEVCKNPSQKIIKPNNLDTHENLGTNTIISITIVLILLFSYILHILIRRLKENKRKQYILKINFPNPQKDLEENHIESMEFFFESLHKLIKKDKISIEIHKVQKKIQIILTYYNKNLTSNIKAYLTSVNRISLEEKSSIEDPVPLYKNKISDMAYLDKKFYCIKESPTFFKQLIDYLSSLEDGKQAGIIFCLRAINKEGAIENKIRKCDQQIRKSEDSSELIRQERNNLSKKLTTGVFLNRIYTVSNSTQVLSGLNSLLASVNGKNKFRFKKFNDLNKLKKRYIPFENFLINIVPRYFGSFLNSKELANLIHPVQIERGKYNSQETIVLESKPEFLENSENNIHIGKSIMKTGEKVNVYLPIENLNRHLYLAGSTGMGKSTVMIKIFLALAKKKDDISLVMLDPHGEDLLEIAYRLDNWDDLVYFNLAESTKTFTFNPLFSFQTSLKDKDNQAEQIMNIITEETLKRNKDMGTSIEKLLRFLIQTAIHFPDAYYNYLINNGKNKEEAKKIVYERQLTFADLSYILQENNGYKNTILYILQDYEEDIALKWRNQLDSFMINKAILDGLHNRLSFLVQDSLVDMFEGMSFDINKLIKEKKRILFPLSEQSFGKISKRIVAKLLLNQIWSGTQSITRKENRNEVVLFIDEFQEAQLNIIDDLLSQARKYKVRLVFGNQFLGQLWDNIRKSVMGNVSTLFSFKVQNLEEAETIAPMFKNKITPENIVSLSKFKAYLRTLNIKDYDDTAFMSFETIDYKSTIPKKYNYADLKKLNEQCLSRYGEEKVEIKKRRLFKIENPHAYFLDLEVYT